MPTLIIIFNIIATLAFIVSIFAALTGFISSKPSDGIFMFFALCIVFGCILTFGRILCLEPFIDSPNIVFSKEIPTKDVQFVLSKALGFVVFEDQSFTIPSWKLESLMRMHAESKLKFYYQEQYGHPYKWTDSDFKYYKIFDTKGQEIFASRFLLEQPTLLPTNE